MVRQAPCARPRRPVTCFAQVEDFFNYYKEKGKTVWRKLRRARRPLDAAVVLQEEAKKAIVEEQRRLAYDDICAWEAVVLRDQDVDVRKLTGSSPRTASGGRRPPRAVPPPPGSMMVAECDGRRGRGGADSRPSLIRGAGWRCPRW